MTSHENTHRIHMNYTLILCTCVPFGKNHENYNLIGFWRIIMNQKINLLIVSKNVMSNLFENMLFRHKIY